MPRENSAYQVYLERRAIVDIILAPQVSEGASAYLKVCVEDFYKAFRETFSDVNIIPKMHYVIHYPRLLVSYGPLSKLSCMRFVRLQESTKLQEYYCNSKSPTPDAFHVCFDTTSGTTYC